MALRVRKQPTCTEKKEFIMSLDKNKVAVQNASNQKSDKKVLAWAIKKYGETAFKDVTEARKLWDEYQERKALKVAAPMVEAKPPGKKKAAIVEPKNDALEALVAGSQKKKAAKQSKEERKAAARAVEVDSEINKSLLQLKLSTNEQLKAAMNAFIDGPVAKVLNSFVALYASRNTDGDSLVAATALNACAAAFDACGLWLADVDTKTKKTKVAKKEKE